MINLMFQQNLIVKMGFIRVEGLIPSVCHASDSSAARLLIIVLSTRIQG